MMTWEQIYRRMKDIREGGCAVSVMTASLIAGLPKDQRSQLETKMLLAGLEFVENFQEPEPNYMFWLGQEGVQ